MVRFRNLTTRDKRWISGLLLEGQPGNDNSWQALVSWLNSAEKPTAHVGLVLEDKQRLAALLYSHDVQERVCTIHALDVPNNLQRQGYGTRAVRLLCRRLLKQHSDATVIAHVEEYNKVGQLFLKSLGFSCLDPRKTSFLSPTGSKCYVFQMDVARRATQRV